MELGAQVAPSGDETDQLKEQRRQAVLARREEMRKRAFENAGEDPAAPSSVPSQQQGLPGLVFAKRL